MLSRKSLGILIDRRRKGTCRRRKLGNLLIQGMRLPSRRFQYAHAHQKTSNKLAPTTLAWALFGHVADCPFDDLPSSRVVLKPGATHRRAAHGLHPDRFSENGKNGEKT
jgi:hypothetical protein